MDKMALIVLARYPEPGRTKTRLARVIGNEQAAMLYKAFLVDLAQRFARPEFNLHWAYTPAERNFEALMAEAVPEQRAAMSLFPQNGDDFGARLLHAFQHVHAGSFERIILIGSDSPQVSTQAIKDAYQALDAADIVLGPADDGGYYLIGMHKPHDVFSGITMSTPLVLQQTIEKAQRQGLHVRLIEQLFDIDEVADLRRLQAVLENEPELAPVTAAQIARMKEYDYHADLTALHLH